MADAVVKRQIAGTQFSHSRERTRSTSISSSSSSSRSHLLQLKQNTTQLEGKNKNSTSRDMYIYQSPRNTHHPPNSHHQQQQHSSHQQNHHHHHHQQQQSRRLLPKEPYGKHNFNRNFHNKPLIPIREGSEESLQLLSAFSEEEEDEEEEEIMLPPLSSDNSYTHTDQVRIVGSASSVDFSEEDEEDLEEDDMSDLLLRLQQSQARMEHIKQMLVNQRGFIVESLKKVAQAQTQHKPKAQNPASTMTKIPINIDEDSESSSYGNTSTPSEPHQISDFKICPMCEVPFPSSMDDYDFESHVLDHFSFSNSNSSEGNNDPSSRLLGASERGASSFSDSS